MFPAGYGDLKLQSSDGVIFYFSGFLLAYSSPIFKDMFEVVAKSNANQNQPPQPNAKNETLVLTEDAATVCSLLLHIDPTKMPFPISMATINKLLDAGRKYQLPTVLQWFEREVTRGEICQEKSDNNQNLIEEDPLLVLSLALEYEMKQLIPKAILAAVNGGPMEESDSWVDIKYYRLIHRLRQKRVEKYLVLIEGLCNLEEPSESDEGEEGYSPPKMFHTCSCGMTRADWILALTRSILKRPRWKSFLAAIESHDYCSVIWSTNFRSKVAYESTRDELCREEQNLPELP